VLERLDFIKRAQVLGFSLNEIKQIINEKEAGQSPCEAVRDVVRTRLQELDAHMKEMRRYRNELAATLAEWDKSGAVDGHICGFIERSDLKHHLANVKARPRLTKKRYVHPLTYIRAEIEQGERGRERS
jgi:DNA-binding transcriptional MerR regulator